MSKKRSTNKYPKQQSLYSGANIGSLLEQIHNLGPIENLVFDSVKLAKKLDLTNQFLDQLFQFFLKNGQNDPRQTFLDIMNTLDGVKARVPNIHITLQEILRQNLRGTGPQITICRNLLTQFLELAYQDTVLSCRAVLDRELGLASRHRTTSDQEFLKKVKSYSPHSLRSLVSKVYTPLARLYNYEAGWGPAGAREFILSLILSTLDGDVVNRVAAGIDEMFLARWTPLQYSDWMDDVIFNHSYISYPAWSEAWRHLESHHKWISDHPCANQGI